MALADAVTLNLAGSYKDFGMLFVKIHEDLGLLFFKIHDDKKAKNDETKCPNEGYFCMLKKML